MEATGAQLVIKLLERQGITTVAGIPGGSILPIYDALYNSSIKHILVRQEQAGGFIAQGIARSTGMPAVCLATSGPGAMNLLTAIADAKADSIPLVAITGQVATSFIGTDAFQEADTFGLSFPITKHSVLVSSAEELLRVIPEAFSIAASGRPGPVLIDIPVNVQQQTVTFEEWPEPGKKTRQAARFRTQGKELVCKMNEFADILLKAENPVIFAGGGCTSTSARKGLLDFLEVFPAPVVTSLMGLCALSSEHRCFYGMTGVYGCQKANDALMNADVILAAGVRFDERAAGRKASYCKGKILHIDIDAAEIDKLVESSVSAVADTETALPVLAECIRSGKARGGRRSPELVEASGAAGVLCSAARDSAGFSRAVGVSCAPETTSVSRAAASSAPQETASEGARLIACLPEAATRAGLDKKNIVVVTDVGQHQMWTAQGYPFTEPRQLLTSGSLGTMGFGLPAAIGAALASPGKRILCISGDGSIMMNVQELATLAELNCDITLAVIDNNALGLVKQLQASGFKHRYSASAYKKPSDIASIAEAFGIPSRHIDGTALITEGACTADKPCADWELFAFPKTGSGPRLVQISVPSSWK
ncbi:MAG: acetolactate synthase large subunit [Spirochaetaceae bacterium]|nr:acetolactate synthase large subunit [Spirochaetaceae bacterium]